MDVPNSALDAILSEAGAGLGRDLHADDTLNTEVGLLINAWCNEKASPELLPFATELVGSLTEMMKIQEVEVAKLDAHKMIAAIALGYQLDIQRMRYLIAAYLRTRLLKIQRWATHLISDADMKSRLSPAELDFAKSFVATRMGHLQASVLNHLPVVYRALVGEEASVLEGPDLNTHVTAWPLENLGDIMLDDEPMDMPAGRAKILSYRHVRDYVAAGKVRLV